MSIICMGILPASGVALAILALINLKKSMPRLLMFFAGTAAATGIYLTSLSWTLGLLLAVAGVAVLVMEGIKQGQIYRDAPKAKTKGKMLIISGVLAILMGLVAGVGTFMAAMILAGIFGQSDMSTAYFFPGLFYVASLIALAVYCFIKRRKTSVFYRMFFLGSVIVFTVQMLVNLVTVFQQAGIMLEMYMGAGSGSFYFVLANIYLFANAAVLIILVLVALHAIRTRKAVAQAIAADEEEGDAAEAEEEDEIDETIGLYTEEDEIDETIGLYKEEDAAEEPAEDDTPKEDK
jgi:hypothetical protein